MILGEPSPAFYPPLRERANGTEHVLFETIEKKYEDPDMATATDIENRINQQNERCIEKLHYGNWNAGNLPESWRRYLVRHWDEIRVLMGNRILSSPEPSVST
jgi:hypothetical protein